MTQSVADRIADIRRTRKRPEQVIANWAGRERRRGQSWLAASIEQQAGIVPKKEPAVVLFKPEKPHYWWLDD